MMEPKSAIVDHDATEQTDVKDVQDGISQYDETLAPTPAQNRRILLKTDLVVLPCAVISMTLAFLDKASLSKSTLPLFLFCPWNIHWLTMSPRYRTP